MHFFLKDFLVEIAVDISPAMKQARWGLFFQVARAGGMQCVRTKRAPPPTSSYPSSSFALALLVQVCGRDQ
jgi:hypothetical protein